MHNSEQPVIHIAETTHIAQTDESDRHIAHNEALATTAFEINGYINEVRDCI